MYGALDISTSGMIAQRTRLEAISANLAQRDSWVQRPDGEMEPFRRRIAMFSAGDPTSASPTGREFGVHVSSIEIDQAPFEIDWKPHDPHAYKSGRLKGYVPRTSIDPITEQVNAIEAIRSYEANVAAAEITKSMTAQALRLLA